MTDKKKEKLTKVVMQYETYKDTLEGKQAEEWLKVCNSQVMMGFVHGQYFPEFKWKTEKLRK